MKIKAFTSDTHYGHNRIIEFCDRPYKDLQEMEEGLIANYNSILGPDDLCIWTGDAFFCNRSRAKEIMNKLNGYKILVKGNHDMKTKHMLEMGFSMVVEQMNIMVAGVKTKLCHYPHLLTEHQGDKPDRYQERRPKYNQSEALIHGHIHENIKLHKNCVHVGVDGWNMFPARYEEVEALIEEMKPRLK